MSRLLPPHLTFSHLLHTSPHALPLPLLQGIEEDGRCTDEAAADALDWGLACLLRDQPEESAPQSLLDALDPEDEDWVDVSLAIALRLSSPSISDELREAVVGGAPGFIARVLLLVEECESI